MYRARDQRDYRDVALKLLKAEGLNAATELQQFFERFTLEARVIEKIRHPVVVQVAEFGSTSSPAASVAFICLEWIDGETLGPPTRRRGQGGRFPGGPRPAAPHLRGGAGRALAAGNAHRDLKPANILIRARLAARPAAGFRHRQGHAEGRGRGQRASRSTSFNLTFSPRYAAPEQLSGARTGPWTDVHALGLLLTEVLTDRPAYRRPLDLITLAEALNPGRPTPRASASTWARGRPHRPRPPPAPRRPLRRRGVATRRRRSGAGAPRRQRGVRGRDRSAAKR
ncbi:MAG: hypothetical protein IPN17_38285 [Deltaproteobacteria bacterium]|nr:hypothetical protein [Deltaproteobacteria bacterium]